MTLRTNLSTRPFYNERAVQAALALVAIVVVVVTFFNLTRVLSLTGRDRRLVMEAEAAEARTDELRRDIARVRSGIDTGHIADIASAAHEANQAIDRRAFSWTDLFNHLESALPRDVRIVAISPRTDEHDQMIVVIEVHARNVEAIGQFFEALEKAGTFRNLLSTQERVTAEGTIMATLEGVYTAPSATTGQATP